MGEIVFLGTSCMKPTRDRSQPAVFLSYKAEGILFDCGEGTQRQFRMLDMKPTKITKILLTHWHGDHMLGLPGMLQTIGSEDYSGTLELYGPKGTKKFFENMTRSFYFDRNLDIKVEDVEEGIFFECEDYYLEALQMDHKVPTLGFAFVEKDRRRIDVQHVKKLGIPDGPILGKLQKGIAVEWKGKQILPEDATSIVKGKKVVYITDTSLCENCYRLAKDADILISEAVYIDNMKEKADEYKHMTAQQAASIANNSGVKQLVLTHFSQRWKTTEDLKEEAQTYFQNTVCAHDLMKIKF